MHYIMRMLIHFISQKPPAGSFKVEFIFWKLLKKRKGLNFKITEYHRFAICSRCSEMIFSPLSPIEKPLSALRSHFLTKILEIFRKCYSKYEKSNAVFRFWINVFRKELRKLTIDGASTDTKKLLKLAHEAYFVTIFWMFFSFYEKMKNTIRF